jgi:hypothetical protein
MRLRAIHLFGLVFPGATALCASCHGSGDETSPVPVDAAVAVPCPDAFVPPTEAELDSSNHCGAPMLSDPGFDALPELPSFPSEPSGGEIPPGTYDAIYSEGYFYIQERLVISGDGRFAQAYSDSNTGGPQYTFYSSGTAIAQDATLVLNAECEVTTDSGGQVVFVDDAGTRERPYTISTTCEHGFFILVVDADRTKVYLKRR